MKTWHRHPSPIGDLLLTADGDALTGLYTPAHKRSSLNPEGRADAGALKHIGEQIDAYFSGTLRVFDAITRPSGTHFQNQVWEYLLTIPYGHTRTYSDIAVAIGSPGAVRAVGAANGANPISIILPCHRVIAKGGALQGYAGGLDAKQWLLEHEGGRVGFATCT